MALRLVNKINRQFIKNVSRSMSTPRDAVDIEPKPEKPNDSLSPIQYQVCRPRTTPVARFHKEVQNEADAAKQYVALQHLQPALLPEYYTSPLEIHSSICPEAFSEVDKQSNETRRFEESKTCMNVTLPLRAPKLASPFPSPVKVMESHTVSDQEKAEQMLAEAKVYKGISANQTRHQHMMKPVSSFRTYSTHNDKSEEKHQEKRCPKFRREEKRRCRKLDMPPCIPPKTISCKRDKIRVECKKKEAPYPSYSESCHEEPLEKPSECKMCPWKPEEHPTFKPPKKDFHTCSRNFLPKKGECDEPAGRNKKSICTEDEKDKKGKQKKRKPKKKCAPTLLAPVGFHVPNSNLSYGLETRAKKIYVKSIKPKLKKSTKSKKNTELTDDISLWLDSVKPIATSSEPNIFAEDSLDMFAATSGHSKIGEGNKPCKKFPFKSEDFPYEKKRTPVAGKLGDKCPKKKSRRMIEDCPKEDDDGRKCVKTSARAQYSVLASKKDEVDKKKCPKVNLGICKDIEPLNNQNEIEDDDPCGRKRRGNTYRCPTDLLKKKKRKNPKKKTTSGAETTVPFSSPAKTIDSTSRV